MAHTETDNRRLLISIREWHRLETVQTTLLRGHGHGMPTISKDFTAQYLEAPLLVLPPVSPPDRSMNSLS
jgi:hypothetical protein